MKNISTLIFAFLITVSSCSPLHTYKKFYNNHKSDIGSTAFQMPRFLSNALSGLSPEMNAVFSNMTDFSFITLTNIDQAEVILLNKEINLIGNGSFYQDIFRKTEKNKRVVVIGKEIKGVVKELVYFNYENSSVFSFYLKGNFDSNLIKEFSEKEEFQNLTKNLLLYQPKFVPNTIQ